MEYLDLPGLVDFKIIHNQLKAKGHDVRMVGGAVRDILSMKVPKDIDFATTAPPEEVARSFSNSLLGFEAIPTGIKHGTVTVVIHGRPYEVTTLRIDKETDGRHAEVEFTTDWEADAARRDLTINAMSMDIDGNIYDYFNGRTDLRTGSLRFVGNPVDRIQEDYLRIMRLFRFASHLERAPTISEPIARAIADNAEGLQGISGERIWKELSGILSGRHRVTVLQNMRQLRVLDQIGLGKLVDNDVLLYLYNIDSEAENRSVVQALAILVHSFSEINELRARLKFDNNTDKIIRYLVTNKYNYMFDGKNFEETVKALVLKGEDPNMLYHLAIFQGEPEVAEFIKWMPPLPKFPVNGNDVKIDLGLSGKDIGRALASMKESWIASGYKMTKDVLIEHYREYNGLNANE